MLEKIRKIYESKNLTTPFEKALEIYNSTPCFKINENVYDKNPNWNDDVHFLMRLIATEKMKKVFKALKIDMDDPNVAENLEEGNIGTAGRIVKMWSGRDTKDDRELMGGRFNKPVRLAKFPNEISRDFDNPIIKEVDLTAVCSHHFAPFSTKFSDKAKIVIAYIPKDYVLGISKLQRVVRFIAQRGWLQEDLTKAIYKEISKTAETDDVYVKLKNIKHSCEFLRGALSESDGFTTEYFGGKFRKNRDLLDFVRNY
ncbi:GTP cyclohydrolase I [Lebetimonas natsushimae]|uniref:GTP cyclohydrolase I n=1 Tax=Lebetimonas natsushimae TaxID=1936991 RepID=A0A292YFQ7_9BACT|nr:GTP cyclohydrolase I [Lebetimonas natsushimae]GAX87840.1 GTP cyclohydrolase I [Lebetimonas natsushimae]